MTCKLQLLCLVMTALAAAGGEKDSSETPRPQPGLNCPAGTHDFGAVSAKQAQACRWAFHLQNNSASPVTVVKHSSTCGCAKVVVPDTPVGPGRETTVEVEVDWSARIGPQEETIVLQSGEPASVVLRVKGCVMKPVNVSPENLDFGTLQPGQTKTLYAEIVRGNTEAPFTIVQADCPDPCLRVRRVSAAEPSREIPLEGGVGRLAITAVGSKQRGEHNGFITFRTDVADQPTVRLWYHMTSVGPYTVSPKLVIFRDAAGRSAQDVKIGSGPQPPTRVSIATMSHSGEHPFEIRSIRSEGTDHCLTTITVSYEPSPAFVRHALLHVCYGGDVIDVPLMVLGPPQHRQAAPPAAK
jgi:hypothetical protein